MLQVTCDSCRTKVTFSNSVEAIPPCPACSSVMAPSDLEASLGSFIVQSFETLENLSLQVSCLNQTLQEIRKEMAKNNETELRKIAFNEALDRARAAIKDTVVKHMKGEKEVEDA